MTMYPIHVPRHRYGGNNLAKRRKAQEYNADAERLETYLNKRILENPEPIQSYMYGLISSDVRMSTERVAEILFAVDCGHNGLTVVKSHEALKQRHAERGG